MSCYPHSALLMLEWLLMCAVCVSSMRGGGSDGGVYSAGGGGRGEGDGGRWGRRKTDVTERPIETAQSSLMLPAVGAGAPFSAHSPSTAQTQQLPYPPTTTTKATMGQRWNGDQPSERLEPADSILSDDHNAQTQCFGTCLCQIVDSVLYKDSSTDSNHWSKHMDQIPKDKDHDIEEHEGEGLGDQSFETSEIHPPQSDLPSQRTVQWENNKEALHVECNHNRNRDLIELPVMDLYQEMSDRLYNVSEVVISQAASLQLPAGLCDLEAEVKQLTWTNSSFGRLHHTSSNPDPSSSNSPASNYNNKGRSNSISFSSNLTACLPLLTSLKLTHSYGLTVLSNLPLLSHLPPKLEDLTLSYNNISVIPTGTFSSAPILLKLDLSHNKLQSIDARSLVNLTALKLLDLSHNGLKYLNTPSTLQSFWVSLDQLDLSHNLLGELPSFLKLSPLHLTRRGKFRPPWSLISLDLSNNQIRHLEAGVFADAVNLRWLDLSFNYLQSVPPGVFTQSLSNLRRLQLSHNQLNRLSARALEGLIRVQVLNLSHNQITGVEGSEFTGGLTPNTPDAGGNIVFNYTSSWPDLQVMDLSYNNISHVSRDMFQSAISSVRVLLLGHNRIHNLPRYGIEMLPNVKTIDLNHNNIDWLDVGSFKNSHLQHINLSHNQLVKLISMAFLFLPAIRTVDLSHNRLNYLYKFPFYKTCERDQAISVDLSGNRLDPDAIWKMLGTFRHLEGTECSVEIHLENNQISSFLGHNLDNYEEHIEENDTEYFHMWNYIQLYLQNNPLRCDCTLYKETEVLNKLREMLPANWTLSNHFHTWRHLRCQEPEELKNKTIEHSIRSIHCKNSLNCPDQCTCVYYPASHMTNVFCQNRNLATFPSVLPSGTKAVYLQNNNISALPRDWNFTDIALLDLSNNSLSALNIDMWQTLLQLHDIYLYGNKLEYIPAAVSNITPAGYISIDDNPFKCGCQMQRIKEWIHYNKYHFIGGPTYCIDSNKKKVQVHRYYWNLVTNRSMCGAEQDGGDGTGWTGVSDHIIVITVCVLVVVCVSTGVLFHRYRYRLKLYFAHRWKWHRFVDDIVTKYDVCIWYNYLDSAWVQRELVPRLIGHNPPYTVSLLHEDMKPGSLLSESFLDGLEYSECSILVLSQRFFDFEWTYEETSSLLFQLLRNQYHRFVAIALEDNLLVNSEDDIELMKKCRKLRSNERRVWEKMFHSLPKPKAPNNGCNVPTSSSNHVHLSVARY